MSDRFKFRIYSFLEKSFYYFSIGDGEDGYPQGLAGGVSEIQQYTGLTDSNEKEIYEGDIIEMTYDHIIERGFVVWENNSYILKTIGEDSYAPLVIFPKDKVIGNIFENKELLK
jgi:hypothetical protein